MSKDEVAEVLSRVPATQFVDGRFILYDKLTFGRSPNWAAAKPLAKAVACMLQHMSIQFVLFFRAGPQPARDSDHGLE